MTTKKIYGPWIKWHGGECPVPPDTPVEVKFHSGFLEQGGRAGGYYWHHEGKDDDIVEYCIAVDQADLDAAEKLLRANDYTVIPPAKPLTFGDVVPMTEAPPKGTEFWVISPAVDEGVHRTRFYDAGFDFYSIKRRMAYLEKEHALIAARHIFGLKGGAL